MDPDDKFLIWAVVKLYFKCNWQHRKQFCGPNSTIFPTKVIFIFLSGYFFLFSFFFLNHSKWSGENRYMCSLKQQQTSVSHFSCLYCKENIVSVTGSHKSHTRALRERREVSVRRDGHVMFII